MRKNLKELLSALFAVVVGMPAIWHLVIFARVVASRLTYPMDIEWMEGGAMLHAYRYLHDLPVYGPPSQGFLPFPYPPGHFLAISLVARLIGLDYAAGRLVSILGFALVLAVAVREVWAHLDRRLLGLLCAMLTAATLMATFPVTGGWYDLIRNDSLVIGLIFLGAGLVADPKPTKVRTIGAAIVFTLAVYTKQTSIFFIPWVGLFLLVRSWRRGLLFGGVLGVLCCALLALAQARTGGYFWVYTMEIMSKHEVIRDRFGEGWGIIAKYIPFWPLLPVLALGLLARRKLSPRTALWLGMLVFSIPASLLPFAKAGGFLNNLIPTLLLLPFAMVMVLADLAKAFRRPQRVVALGAILASMSLFLVLRTYNFRKFEVTPARLAQAQALNAKIAALDGDVIIPNHPFVALRNGHSTLQIHEMPYEDAMGAKLPGLDLPSFLMRVHAPYAVLSGAESPPVRGWFRQLYQPAGQLPGVSSFTGYRSGPRELYTWRGPEPVRRRRHVLFDFEGELTGWQVSGDAFARGVWGERGGRHVNTWHPSRGDDAVGTATSPSFSIDRSTMGFLIAGGAKATTRLELRVDGDVVRSASGVDSEERRSVRWDVSAYKGRSATVAIIDGERGGWGHLVVDEIELFDQ